MLTNDHNKLKIYQRRNVTRDQLLGLRQVIPSNTWPPENFTVPFFVLELRNQEVICDCDSLSYEGIFES